MYDAYFYLCLCICAQGRSGHQLNGNVASSRVGELCKQFDGVADQGLNYASRVALIQAELAGLKGDMASGNMMLKSLAVTDDYSNGKL